MAKKPTKTKAAKPAPEITEDKVSITESDIVVVSPEDVKDAMDKVNTDLAEDTPTDNIEQTIDIIESAVNEVSSIEADINRSVENLNKASENEDNVVKAAEQAMTEAKECEDRIKKIEKANYNFTNFWNGQSIY